MPKPIVRKAASSQRKLGYIPSLDGWRAIAILAVIWVHEPLASPSLFRFQQIGGAGVDLFFAISGILITTRILEEESLCGFFDIRKFYIRRIFRIQPAAWLYLAVVATLLAGGFLHILWHYWFGALGMYENFLYAGKPTDYQGFFVGHFWTLAVEEHFYILLSLFLLFVKRNRLAILTWILLGLMAFWSVSALLGHVDETTARRTYYQLQELVYGACFAIALRNPAWRARAERYLKPWIVFSVTLAIILGRTWMHRILWPSAIDPHPAAIIFLRNFVFAFWIVATMLHSNSLSTKILEWAPLRWLGRLSYSLYLWHVLFFFRVDPNVSVTLPALTALSGRPAKYLAALTAAVLSYYLVEKPLMRVGHRLAPPATPGRPELAADPIQITADQPIAVCTSTSSQ